jgi:hypothetical protein
MRHRGPRLAITLAALVVLGSIATFSACEQESRAPRASATQVAARAQLIGGPTALGEVGDYLLENDQIRILLQDKGFNRGSGLFGGSLIDADIVRGENKGGAMGGNGRDTFGELFPAFFLEVIDPQDIVVVNDGTDGTAAIVEVRGRGGEFVTMLRFFNQAMINSYAVDFRDLLDGKPANSDGDPLVEFTHRFILEPGARHVRMEGEMVNVSFQTLNFPNQQVLGAMRAFLPGVDFSSFRVPTGMVLGFGNLNKIFLPGIGYDIRWGIEEAYEQPVELPGFPGLRTDLVASSSTRGVSYGFATASDPNNFVYSKNELYGGNATPEDMLFLFYASGFGGVFTSQTPTSMAPAFCEEGRSAEDRCQDFVTQCTREDGCQTERNRCVQSYPACLQAKQTLPSKFTFTNYFIVGTGDVASIRDEYYRIRGTETRSVQGRVFDEKSATHVGEHVSVLIYEGRKGETSLIRACETSADAEPRLLNQAYTNSAGYFELQLPDGIYCHQVQRTGHPLGELKGFAVDGKPVSLRVVAPTGGLIVANIVDSSGTPLPAKMTIVGSFDNDPAIPPRQRIYNLRVGEHWRTTPVAGLDQLGPVPYIEDVAFAGADGRFETWVRPGRYTVYFSRGNEYALDTREIEVKSGSVTTINAQIKRVVRPEGYLSGDFHLHAQGSIDSGLDYNARVISVAAEGVEVAVATDHNYISDYLPYIHSNKLQPWLRSVIGLELTTFEAGHFNGFPLAQQISAMNRGSMAWQDVPPQAIFDALRELGSLGPENTIIQVNHPRDMILGYFNQHNVDPFDTSADLKFNTATGLDRTFALLATPTGPAFIEPYEEGNRTRYRSTFSWDFDAIEIFNGKRYDLIRHFRMPWNRDEIPQHILDQLTEEELEALPAKGVILCDDDAVAFPGALDDWYNLLNYPRPDGTYRRYTATGNSDSHYAGGPSDPEPGFPRNYFYVGHNNPTAMTDLELVTALKSHHNIITNGPFINMTINGNPVGSTFAAQGSTVSVRITVEAPHWIVPNRFNLVANGEVVARGEFTLQDGKWSDTLAVPISGDTWFVLEVEGDQSLFPIVRSEDIPRMSFDAAIGSLAGPFGFGGGVDGLAPAELFDVTPWAFTNPIWVIDPSVGGANRDFTPASPPVRRCVDGQLQVNQLHRLEDFRPPGTQRLDAATVPFDLHPHLNPLFERTQGQTRDLRLLFDAFGHGH